VVGDIHQNPWLPPIISPMASRADALRETLTQNFFFTSNW